MAAATIGSTSLRVLDDLIGLVQQLLDLHRREAAVLFPPAMVAYA
jgi:hypothetical protein